MPIWSLRAGISVFLTCGDEILIISWIDALDVLTENDSAKEGWPLLA